ncbi:MAG: heparinase II/III family protein [Lachnospiraceae bacterium]|nr:heparinase II/III family protein [Lachnospiraceae bacterium]
MKRIKKEWTRLLAAVLVGVLTITNIGVVPAAAEGESNSEPVMLLQSGLEGNDELTYNLKTSSFNIGNDTDGDGVVDDFGDSSASVGGRIPDTMYNTWTDKAATKFIPFYATPKDNDNDKSNTEANYDKGFVWVRARGDKTWKLYPGYTASEQYVTTYDYQNHNNTTPWQWTSYNSGLAASQTFTTVAYFQARAYAPANGAATWTDGEEPYYTLKLNVPTAGTYDVSVEAELGNANVYFYMLPVSSETSTREQLMNEANFLGSMDLRTANTATFDNQVTVSDPGEYYFVVKIDDDNWKEGETRPSGNWDTRIKSIILKPHVYENLTYNLMTSSFNVGNDTDGNGVVDDFGDSSASAGGRIPETMYNTWTNKNASKFIPFYATPSGNDNDKSNTEANYDKGYIWVRARGDKTWKLYPGYAANEQYVTTYDYQNHKNTMPWQWTSYNSGLAASQTFTTLSHFQARAYAPANGAATWTDGEEPYYTLKLDVPTVGTYDVSVDAVLGNANVYFYMLPVSSETSTREQLMNEDYFLGSMDLRTTESATLDKEITISAKGEYYFVVKIDDDNWKENETRPSGNWDTKIKSIKLTPHAYDKLTYNLLTTSYNIGNDTDGDGVVDDFGDSSASAGGIIPSTMYNTWTNKSATKFIPFYATAEGDKNATSDAQGTTYSKGYAWARGYDKTWRIYPGYANNEQYVASYDYQIADNTDQWQWTSYNSGLAASQTFMTEMYLQTRVYRTTNGAAPWTDGEEPYYTLKLNVPTIGTYDVSVEVPVSGNANLYFYMLPVSSGASTREQFMSEDYFLGSMDIRTTSMLTFDKQMTFTAPGEYYFVVKIDDDNWSAEETRPSSNWDIRLKNIKFTLEGTGGLGGLVSSMEEVIDEKAPSLDYATEVLQKIDAANATLVHTSSNYVYTQGVKSQKTAQEVADILANSAGKQVVTGDYGLSIISDSALEFTDKEMRSLQEYMLYTRPTAADIKESFAAMENVHPRIVLTQDKFDEIVANYNAGHAVVKEWGDAIILKSDLFIKGAHIKYANADGSKGTAHQDTVNRAMYLSMAYKLTGDSKYKDYLWEEIENVCNFPEWYNKWQFLDTGEFLAGFAIAYDWMYDEWTEDQRAIMEEAILKHGLYWDQTYLYGTGAVPNTFVFSTTNRNAVTNGGSGMAAIALYDKYPDICADLLEKTYHAIEIGMREFAPDGATTESPNYWEYTLRYLSMFMASTEVTFGTDFNILKAPGFDKTGEFYVYIDGLEGCYNYHDSGVYKKLTSSTLFWYSNVTQKPGLTQIQLLKMKNNNVTGDVYSIMFYDPAIEPATEITLDTAKYFGRFEFVSMRSNWTDNEGIYTAFHTGQTNISHAHMDSGSFVLDIGGQRFAGDYGSEDYSLYPSQNPEDKYHLFRLSPEGHNIFVINPDTSFGQTVSGNEKITEFVNKEKGSYAIASLDSYYKDESAGVKYADSATRGIMLADEKRSVVIRDEIKGMPLDENQVYWFMQMQDVEVEIAADKKSAILRKGGVDVHLQVASDNATDFEITVTEACELVPDTTIYKYDQQKVNTGWKRLAIVFTSGKDLNINVKMSRLGDSMGDTPIEEIPLADWNIEDGPAAEFPKLDSIVMGGQALDGFDENVKAYDYTLPYGAAECPTITATGDANCDIQITKPEALPGKAVITIINKDNAKLATTYTVNIKVASDVVIEASGNQDGNPPENCMDGDITTRWAVDGVSYGIFTFSEPRNVSSVWIASWLANQRYLKFDLEVSTDGTNFTSVIQDGKTTVLEAGEADKLEEFAIPEGNYKAVRIWLYGSEYPDGRSTTWNSLLEVEFTGNGPVFDAIPNSETNAGSLFTQTVTVTGYEGAKVTVTAKALPEGAVFDSETNTLTWTPTEEQIGTHTVSLVAEDASGRLSNMVFNVKVLEAQTGGGDESIEILENRSDKNWTQDTLGTVTIYCTGALADFLRVEVDGVTVDSSYYTLEEGSTILTFKVAYLNTLSEGDHTVVMHYTNDRSVQMTLTVHESVEQDSSDEQTDVSDQSQQTEVSDQNQQTQAANPKTGDDSRILMYIIFVICGMVLLVSWGIYRRRKMS